MSRCVPQSKLLAVIFVADFKVVGYTQHTFSHRKIVVFALKECLETKMLETKVGIPKAFWMHERKVQGYGHFHFLLQLQSLAPHQKLLSSPPSIFTDSLQAWAGGEKQSRKAHCTSKWPIVETVGQYPKEHTHRPLIFTKVTIECRQLLYGIGSSTPVMCTVTVSVFLIGATRDETWDLLHVKPAL